MDAFIGEIRAFTFSFVPVNWIGCYGQVVPITQYQALFSLLGNAYGGDQTKGTFGIPNLQGVTPIGLGIGPGLTTPRIMGKTYGHAGVALSDTTQVPPHNHTVTVERPASGHYKSGTLGTPVANSSWLAQATQPTSDAAFNAVWGYIKNTGQSFDTTLHPRSIGSACGNSDGSVTAHENRQPYLPLVFCICALDNAYPNFN